MRFLLSLTFIALTAVISTNGTLLTNLRNLAQGAIESFASIKPEDIKNLMDAMQKPEERKVFTDLLQALIRKAPQDELIGILSESDVGMDFVEKFMPLIQQYMAFKETLVPAMESFKLSKTGR